MLVPSGVVEVSRQNLPWELFGVVAATVFLASGVASMVLAFLRSRDRLLSWLIFDWRDSVASETS
jgi:hypothetical protein